MTRETPPSRREFLKLALLGAATAGFVDAGSWKGVYAATPAQTGGQPVLGIARNGSPEEMARAAVKAVGSMRAFVSRGDVVVVKPNIGWDRIPAQAANTDPQVVKAVVAMCLEAGAKKVRVMDRTCNDPRRCYKQSGIQDAVLSLNDPAATVEHIDERKYVEVKIRNPQGTLESWTFHRDLIEADKAINVPVAKHHNAARLTMSLKNIMGILGGNRGNIHRDLDRNIADLNAVFRFHLVVMDAVRVLTANGPQGGREKDVRVLNTVVAGTDPVAIDSYGATLFGLTASDVPHVVHAAKLGLGEIDLAKVRLSVTEMG